MRPRNLKDAMNLILPPSMGAPSIPDFFLRGMRELDPALVCYWNPNLSRFVIDRKIERGETTHVLVVQDPEGGYMTPNDRTLDWLKAHDAWMVYGSVENQRKARENAKAEFDAKRIEQAQRGYQEAVRDNRIQLNKAALLFDRHDISRVHQ